MDEPFKDYASQNSEGIICANKQQPTTLFYRLGFGLFKNK